MKEIVFLHNFALTAIAGLGAIRIGISGGRRVLEVDLGGKDQVNSPRLKSQGRTYGS
jgi:hypothetical protein